MEKIGLTPDKISIMVLTHSHPDHIGSSPSIKALSGCSVLAHRNEKSWIEDVELQFQERPVPNFHSLVEGSVQVDNFIDDGDLINLGDLKLEVIHTPGHSKGSISLYLSLEGVLISGDSIPLEGDLPIYEDVTDSLKSIERLKKVEGIKTLLASWDDPRKDAYQIMENGLIYLQKIQEAVVKVEGKYNKRSDDPLDFARLVLIEIGLPEMVVNPIIARSFKSNLDIIKTD
jgi:hydroxyacylglutathione hydrolase